MNFTSPRTILFIGQRGNIWCLKKQNKKRDIAGNLLKCCSCCIDSSLKPLSSSDRVNDNTAVGLSQTMVTAHFKPFIMLSIFRSNRCIHEVIIEVEDGIMLHWSKWIPIKAIFTLNWLQHRFPPLVTMHRSLTSYLDVVTVKYIVCSTRYVIVSSRYECIRCNALCVCAHWTVSGGPPWQRSSEDVNWWKDAWKRAPPPTEKKLASGHLFIWLYTYIYIFIFFS